MQPTIANLEISANLWTSRNGNTYHRVYITVDGRSHEQLVSEPTYGGGCQYLETAGAMLQAAGVSRGTRARDLVVSLRGEGTSVSEGYQRVRRKRDM